MSDIHDSIVEKLKRKKPEVAELAIQAIELSSKYPESTVSEQLEVIARRITSPKKGQKS